MKFVNRKEELEILNRFYEEDTFPVYPDLWEKKDRKDRAHSGIHKREAGTLLSCRQRCGARATEESRKRGRQLL